MDSNELIASGLLFLAPLAASAVSLTALHYFPWNRGVRPLKPTTAYALGTLVTVGVPVLAMLMAVLVGVSRGELFWAALLVVNALISGATVNACYWIDGARALTLEDAANERR